MTVLDSLVILQGNSKIMMPIICQQVISLLLELIMSQIPHYSQIIKINKNIRGKKEPSLYNS